MLTINPQGLNLTEDQGVTFSELRVEGDACWRLLAVRAEGGRLARQARQYAAVISI